MGKPTESYKKHLADIEGRRDKELKKCTRRTASIGRRTINVLQGHRRRVKTSKLGIYSKAANWKQKSAAKRQSLLQWWQSALSKRTVCRCSMKINGIDSAWKRRPLAGRLEPLASGGWRCRRAMGFRPPFASSQFLIDLTQDRERHSKRLFDLAKVTPRGFLLPGRWSLSPEQVSVRAQGPRRGTRGGH